MTPVSMCLQLWHWVKCHKDNAGNVRPADAGEYQFAKYNKKVSLRALPRLIAAVKFATKPGTHLICSRTCPGMFLRPESLHALPEGQ